MESTTEQIFGLKYKTYNMLWIKAKNNMNWNPWSITDILTSTGRKQYHGIRESEPKFSFRWSEEHNKVQFIKDQ